jgi:hypothetical protein
VAIIAEYETHGFQLPGPQRYNLANAQGAEAVHAADEASLRARLSALRRQHRQKSRAYWWGELGIGHNQGAATAGLNLPNHIHLTIVANEAAGANLEDTVANILTAVVGASVHVTEELHGADDRDNPRYYRNGNFVWRTEQHPHAPADEAPKQALLQGVLNAELARMRGIITQCRTAAGV